MEGSACIMVHACDTFELRGCFWHELRHARTPPTVHGLARGGGGGAGGGAERQAETPCSSPHETGHEDELGARPVAPARPGLFLPTRSRSNPTRVSAVRG